jgi:glycosyltransferase involved in cell wall biosynthesis
MIRKIGIDARLYSQTGVGVYIQNLLFYMHENFSKDYNFYIYVIEDDYATVKRKFNNFLVKKTSCRWHSFKEQVIFAFQLYKDGLDLVHFTYFSYPIIYLKPFVATVHDLIPLKLKTGRASTKNPIFYYFKHICFRFVLQCQIYFAKAIITPTKTVKGQISEFFGEKLSKKVYPIYSGVNQAFLQSKENKSLDKNYGKLQYLLYVGNLYPHKNVNTLIDAFKFIENKDLILLICTKDNYFADRTKNYINKRSLQNNILFYHGASNEELVYFYKNAQALVHPSLSEGLGLPLLEAMHFGLPIIASDIPVFQEVMGDDYIAFDPKDSKDIAKKIDFSLGKNKKISYNTRIDGFSFSSMSERIFSLYQGILDPK